MPEESATVGPVYVSGAAMLSRQFMFDDWGMMLPNEIVEMAGRVATATPIPVITDADQAGETPLNTYRMVKDHRTGFEIGNTDRVLDGDLDGFIRAALASDKRGRPPVHGARGAGREFPDHDVARFPFDQPPQHAKNAWRRPPALSESGRQSHH